MTRGEPGPTSSRRGPVLYLLLIPVLIGAAVFMFSAQNPLGGLYPAMPDAAVDCDAVRADATADPLPPATPRPPEVNVTTTEPTSALQFVIVVCLYHDQAGRLQPDVSWLDSELGYVPRVVYIHEKTRGLPHHVLGTGKEAACYLQFMHDYYDHLPAYAAFLHGHKDAWHSSHLVKILQGIKLDGKHPFMNLNWCAGDFYNDKSIKMKTGDDTNRILHTYWDQSLREFLGPMPERLQYYCCAQFVASKDAIRTRPKAFYRSMLDWLKSTGANDYDSSRVFEYMWSYILGMPAEMGRQQLCEITTCDSSWGCRA